MSVPVAPLDPTPCVCSTLRKASRAVTRLYDERLGSTGLTITQFSALRALLRQTDQPLSRLAERMVMDRTSLYRLIAPLERDGFVTVSNGDGRSRVAALTAEGRAALDAATPFWERAQSEFIAQFGKTEWAELASTLSQIVSVAGQGEAP